MKILSVVGARPEFIQAMPVSKALRMENQEILIHTGQHYDFLMSQTFFEELEIPHPDYYLGVGSGSHGQQTAEILVRLETVLLKEKPDWVIVRGDTNSTVASSLAASKLHIPIAHVEAGERSYNRRMPEEINRIVTDHISDLLFCVTQRAVHNLAQEGISDNVYWVGDVMMDAMLQVLPFARRKSNILVKMGLKTKEYALVTIHRAANTDESERLSRIIEILNRVGEPVVFPVHPRTRKAFNRLRARFLNHVYLIDPVGYLDMLVLEENARLIATDSGGVQREAYFLGIPCLTLRDETEWVETVTSGWNKLVGVEPKMVVDVWMNFTPPRDRSLIFGDGTAAQKIASLFKTQKGRLQD
jgi:UDP-GlcNAc3NAcA epimerase